MAFRDSNGTITIDEVAAEKDIKQLRLSKENMEMALKELQEILAQADEFSGNTGMRIRDASMAMINDINKSIEGIDTTIEHIQMTVNKYQQIDLDLKKMIESRGSEEFK